MSGSYSQKKSKRQVDPMDGDCVTASAPSDRPENTGRVDAWMCTYGLQVYVHDSNSASLV
jgi:hypothetical protein